MGSHSWVGGRRSFGAPPSSVIRGSCDFKDALVPAWRCGRAGGPATASCPRAGIRWGALSPCAACRGREEEGCSLGSQQRVHRHFPEQGGGETPWNVVSILSTLRPPPPSGQPQGEGLAHLRQSQRLSALAGFARVLRCGTECELPALAAMPGRSPRLEHSPPSKCRESRGCQPLFPGFENSAPVVTMSCLQWIYK